MTPPRVRVTAPRTGVGPARRTPAGEIDAQSEVGAIYMRSLLRAQARLALLVLGPLAVLGIGLPLLLRLAPGLGDVMVLGVPLPWALLGFAVYPVLVGLGWVYVVAAERTERRFDRMLSDPEQR